MNKKFMITVFTVLVLGCSQPSAVGKYNSVSDPSEYIFLEKDGSFAVSQNSGRYTGTYRITDKNIYLDFSDGHSAVGRIDGKVLIDPDGAQWVRD